MQRSKPRTPRDLYDAIRYDFRRLDDHEREELLAHAGLSAELVDRD